MAEPTKTQIQEQLAQAQAELADKRPGVITALHGVLRDMPEMAKRRVQSFQAFNVDDVYATLRPLLVKHGLVIVPAVRSVDYDHGTFQKGTEFIDARIVVDYDIWCTSDGTRIQMTGAAEGRDTQDKATNKALQQAFKYALIQLLLINTGEDAEEDPGGGDKPKGRRPRERSMPEKQELTAEQISEKLTNAAKATVFKLVGNDKAEAESAWPLVLEVAGLDTIKTKEDKDKVIEAAVEMFGHDDDDDGSGYG